MSTDTGGVSSERLSALRAGRTEQDWPVHNKEEEGELEAEVGEAWDGGERAGACTRGSPGAPMKELMTSMTGKMAGGRPSVRRAHGGRALGVPCRRRGTPPTSKSV